MRHSYWKHLLLLLVASVAGCGGGGGSTTSNPNADPNVPPPVTTIPIQNPVEPLPVNPDPAAPMTMSCVDGPTYQCSGGSIVRNDNGVALTSSGVQVYGRSTSDMRVPNPNVTGAFGLALASGGVAEVRIAKDGNGVLSTPALLLSNLGLSWDGSTERPQIVDTFNPTQGRVQLGANGALVFSALPAPSNLGFYDFAGRLQFGTQANYANNRYFPRSNPSRCIPMTATCATTETTGLHYNAGDWRTGGGSPDVAEANRVHGDGDIHAGDVPPPFTGTGPGVPFPGSKGYRVFDIRSFQYGNLASWVTQDTVQIGEWGAQNEHNKNRRGMVAFGHVSASVPTSGSATYSGIANGWYAPNASAEPISFRATVSVAVNFTSRAVAVTIRDTVTNDGLANPVPVAPTGTAIGSASAEMANYFTGPVGSGTLAGGLSGRYFGPIVTTGASGAGPAEISGAFSLSHTDGRAVIGGFIARKQ